VTAAEGPGSWGFEGPEVIMLGVRESATTFQKTPVESVDGSMIGEASATCLGSADVSSMAGSG
jgi:hypothetical protein